MLCLLVVPGVVGFDAWPLTAWRLFSADRGDDPDPLGDRRGPADGTVEPVDLDELPIAFRNAEWILVQLPGRLGRARREEVCQALLDGVREHVDPEAVGLVLVRNRREMVEAGRTASTRRRPRAVHTCEASEGARHPVDG